LVEGRDRWLGWPKHGRWLVFAGTGYVYWATRRKSGISALVTLLVILYVLTSGFGLQWTLWVVPFALLAGDLKWLSYYTLGALLYMLPAYYGYHFDPVLLRYVSPEQMNIILIVSAIPVWVLSVGWALRRLGGTGQLLAAEVAPGHSMPVRGDER
jgi:hypothetical protein